MYYIVYQSLFLVKNVTLKTFKLSLLDIYLMYHHLFTPILLLNLYRLKNSPILSFSHVQNSSLHLKKFVLALLLKVYKSQ